MQKESVPFDQTIENDALTENPPNNPISTFLPPVDYLNDTLGSFSTVTSAFKTRRQKRREHLEHLDVQFAAIFLAFYLSKTVLQQ